MKAVIAKVVLAFQSTDEYNTILFQWHFKGFELLRRYLIKHGPGTDLEELDFEAVDKEMEEDERPWQLRQQHLLVWTLLRLIRMKKTLPLLEPVVP